MVSYQVVQIQSVRLSITSAGGGGGGGRAGVPAGCSAGLAGGSGGGSGAQKAHLF